MALFIFYKLKIASADNINFIDLLWRVFVTGLITTLASLFFRFFTMMLGDTTLVQDPLFNRLLYNINLGLLSAVLISCFAVFRRLILYQKSKLLMNIWRFFNFSLLLSLAYDATYLPFLSFFSEYFRVLLILLSLYLSVNMKWVAYLNFKQKWKGLLLVTLALFYIVYFVWTLRTSVVDFYDFNLRFKDFQEHIFTMALIVFVIVYTLFSLLVILFNLPTSSVFEQKLEEVVNFQKLSQSIQTEQNEERVYDILLESSVSTVFADAAWFELTENGRPSYHCYQITEEEAISIKSKLLDSKVKGLFDQGPDKSKNASKVLKSIRGSRFNSLIGTPIIVKNKQIGFLMLLKEVSDGFNKEMEKIISTFANQAGISIENFRLLSEVLENERYKEELNIAKRVQSSLLPKTLHSNSDFEIIAFTHSATEVGGDYYDTFKIDDEKVAIIIGDVSGKGTSAAFHMSQMKGIFHSLSQVNPSPREFLKKANIALSECLEKSSFITISYFLIDQKTSSVKFSRAGHCPTLYYHANSKKAEYFKNKGMGLGLVRNEGYDKFIHVNKFNYEPGDLIILYTDGITEATNPLGNEYGYKRLESAVVKHAAKKPEKIMDNLLNDFYEFTGTKSINDDYTIVLIRFKKETN
ncbi:MAG: SpoIIE family protein phosphatase [Cyclobacteriaceae bacterium]|nr:SpoIIE family protein phosphatase [Cyclobacteriaceae bacterium]